MALMVATGGIGSCVAKALARLERGFTGLGGRPQSMVLAVSKAWMLILLADSISELPEFCASRRILADRLSHVFRRFGQI